MMRYVILQAREGGEVYAEPLPPSNTDFPLVRGMILANRYMPPNADIEIGSVWADNADAAVSNREGIEWVGSYKTPSKDESVRNKDTQM